MSRYLEFAVASNFSFLRGASHAEELMLQAAHIGLDGIGLCDRNSVAGVVRAHLIKREQKLASKFDKRTVRELRKRLERAASELNIPQGAEPLRVALRQVADLGQDDAPLTEKVLHEYRIAGKRARYIAELAGDNSQAQSVVEQLKLMQDVVGDWHDSLKLTKKAEEMFGGVVDSGLVAGLRNVTRAKFHRAFEVLANTRAALSAKKPVSAPITTGRKLSVRAKSQAVAA